MRGRGGGRGEGGPLGPRVFVITKEAQSPSLDLLKIQLDVVETTCDMCDNGFRIYQIIAV